MQIKIIQVCEEDYFFSLNDKDKNSDIDVAIKLRGNSGFTTVVVRDEGLVNRINERFGWRRGSNALGAAARFCVEMDSTKVIKLLESAEKENWVTPTNIRRLVNEIEDRRARKILEILSVRSEVNSSIETILREVYNASRGV